MNSIYKIKEKEHYDLNIDEGKKYDYCSEEGTSLKDKVFITARKYLENRAFEIIRRRGNGKMLDFGCSIGSKTFMFASDEWQITGVDISPKSIKIAKRLSKRHKLNMKFYVMDCENLLFDDNEFDIVYDFGTLSSLNKFKAVEEICRVLKDDGYLLAIETLGNNLVFSLKRRINLLLGLRTKWAVNNILKISQLNKIAEYFYNSEIRYFSLLTPYLPPVLNLIPKDKHISVISFIDYIGSKLLKYKIFRKAAFKAVFIMKNPKKGPMAS